MANGIKCINKPTNGTKMLISTIAIDLCKYEPLLHAGMSVAIQEPVQPRIIMRWFTLAAELKSPDA
jgi:hypothetical protein